MGVNAFTLDVILQITKILPDRPVKMLVLGYPDIVLSEDRMESLFGKETANDLLIRHDSDRIIAWHSMTRFIDKIPDAYDFF